MKSEMFDDMIRDSNGDIDPLAVGCMSIMVIIMILFAVGVVASIVSGSPDPCEDCYHYETTTMPVTTVGANGQIATGVGSATNRVADEACVSSCRQAYNARHSH